MKRQEAELQALGSIISLIDANLFGDEEGDLFVGILELPGRDQNRIKAAMVRELKRLRERLERLEKRKTKP